MNLTDRRTILDTAGFYGGRHQPESWDTTVETGLHHVG